MWRLPRAPLPGTRGQAGIWAHGPQTLRGLGEAETLTARARRTPPEYLQPQDQAPTHRGAGQVQLALRGTGVPHHRAYQGRTVGLGRGLLQVKKNALNGAGDNPLLHGFGAPESFFRQVRQTP